MDRWFSKSVLPSSENFFQDLLFSPGAIWCWLVSKMIACLSVCLGTHIVVMANECVSIITSVTGNTSDDVTASIANHRGTVGWITFLTVGFYLCHKWRLCLRLGLEWNGDSSHPATAREPVAAAVFVAFCHPSSFECVTNIAAVQPNSLN